MEASASDVDEERLRKARDAIMDEIGLKHPIMFDIYDVCSLAREARLSSLKFKMLRGTCKHSELAFKMQDTNAAPLAKNGGSDFGVQLLFNLVMTSTY